MTTITFNKTKASPEPSKYLYFQLYGRRKDGQLLTRTQE